MSTKLEQLKARVDTAMKKTNALQASMTELSNKRTELDKVKVKSVEQTSEISRIDQEIGNIYTELMTAGMENTAAADEFAKELTGQDKKEKFLGDIGETFADVNACSPQGHHWFCHGIELVLLAGVIGAAAYLYYKH